MCNSWLVSHRERAVTQFEVVPLFCEAYNATATVQSAVNGFPASGTWPFKDATFDYEFAPLEAVAANHDQLVAAADQPCAAVIYLEATAEQQVTVFENPEAVAGEHPKPLLENTQQLLKTPSPLLENTQQLLKTPSPLLENTQQLLKTPSPLLENTQQLLKTPSPLLENTQQLLKTPRRTERTHR